MTYPSGHLTHLIPSPEEGQCHRLVKGWPHPLRPCSGRVSVAELSSHPEGNVSPKLCPEVNNRATFKPLHSFVVRRNPGPSTSEMSPHACSDILKCGSYR